MRLATSASPAPHLANDNGGNQCPTPQLRPDSNGCNGRDTALSNATSTALSHLPDQHLELPANDYHCKRAQAASHTSCINWTNDSKLCVTRRTVKHQS